VADLVLNTLGALLGGGVVLLWRRWRTDAGAGKF
jgi:glycopeptide antibiotics resistance protein